MKKKSCLILIVAAISPLAHILELFKLFSYCSKYNSLSADVYLKNIAVIDCPFP